MERKMHVFGRVLIVVSGMAMALMAASSQVAAQPFKYMTDAANRIKDIEYKKYPLSPDDNVMIVRIQCEALTTLIKDANFTRALQDILSPGNLNDYRSPAYALLNDLPEFNKTFLPEEQADLLKAGVQYPEIFTTLDIASRERARAALTEVSSVSVMYAVEVAQRETCRLATEAVNDRQRKASQWTWGGILLVVVDVGAIAAAAGASGGAAAPAAATIAVTSISIGAQAAISGAKGDIP
jgi:hypothetical protein